VTPNIESLISRGVEAAFSGVHVHAPARVVSFDADKRTCEVQPLTRRPVTDEDDAVTYADAEPVANVPVLFPGGAGFSLAWDLAAGDVVLLAYLDFSPAGWRERGITSDAGDARQLGPSYPVALPWYRPGGGAGELDDGPGLGIPGNAARLTFHTSHVQVGNGADYVALAGLVATELGKIATALGSLSCAAAPGPVVAASPYTPAPVAASKLKTD
jgi:hypothetical protein